MNQGEDDAAQAAAKQREREEFNRREEDAAEQEWQAVMLQHTLSGQRWYWFWLSFGCYAGGGALALLLFRGPWRVTFEPWACIAFLMVVWIGYCAVRMGGAAAQQSFEGRFGSGCIYLLGLLLLHSVISLAIVFAGCGMLLRF